MSQVLQHIYVFVRIRPEGPSHIYIYIYVYILCIACAWVSHHLNEIISPKLFQTILETPKVFTVMIRSMSTFSRLKLSEFCLFMQGFDF